MQTDPFKASLLTGAAPTGPIHDPAQTTTSVTHGITTDLANTKISPTSVQESDDQEAHTVLRVDYKATTNRMLRVAVNGFFESLSVVIQVMEELDVDVLHEKGIEGLEGVQGVEVGMTGTTVTGA